MDKNAPNRHPVIRFFISSTFSDMERERNIIRSIFKELKISYKKQGWQLDLVDLRWGINQIEGFDNKTMSICLGEIKHCQTVSPKPNFIMLVGEYFGWSPLPEQIRLSEMEDLNLSVKNQTLFNKWYIRDDNYSDEPRYILKGRDGKYLDNNTFHEEVEKPLSKALILLTKGFSATQMEILKGMESVEAQNHIIAYVRTIKKAPETFKSSKFREKISQTFLRRFIRSRFNQHHFFAPTFNYQDYVKGDYDKIIYDNLKKQIIDVVEKEIDSCDRSPHDYEIHEHFEYANKLAKEFIGREKEIELIFEYINNPHADKPLWITGPVGIGKTALVSKIAAINGFNKTTIIFCGLTEKSSSPHLIEETIHERTKPLRYQNVTSNGEIKSFDRGFPWLIRSSSAHHLFIIDNAGGIKGAYLPNIFRFKAKTQYAPGIKIIFTSTIGDNFIPIDNYNKILLQPLNLNDSNKIVLYTLKLNGRTITEAQQRAVSTQLCNADRTGRYLRLLSLYLSGIQSWENIPKIPLNSLSLSYMLIQKILTEDNKYGYGAAPLVLCAFAMDRIGLDDDEILNLMLSDSLLWTKLNSSSFHSLTDKSVPPIIWTRLYARINPLLTNVYYKYGAFYTISNNEIRKHIYNSLVASQKGVQLLYRCWQFYKENIQSIHLASQALYLGYETLKVFKSIYGRTNEFYEKLNEIIESSFLNRVFLAKAFSIDRNDTLNIIDSFLSEIMLEETSQQTTLWRISLISIRKKLGNLSAVYSQEATLAALGIVPDCYPCKLIPNQFSNLSWEPAIIDSLSYPTVLSRISSDGNNVILVKNEGVKSSIYSYSNIQTVHTEKFIFEFEDIVEAIAISNDANTICVCGRNKTHIFMNNIAYKYDYQADDVYVSSDGNTILLSKEDQFNILCSLKPTVKKEAEQGGVLSRDGQCAWGFTEKTVLSRITLSPYVEENKFTYQGEADDFGLEKKIVACSKHYCIISSFGGVRYSDRGYIIHYDENNDTLIMNKFPLFVHDRPGHVWINESEDKMLIYERANLVLWDLNPLKLVACIETDYVIDVTPDFSLLLSKKGQIIDFIKLLHSNKFLAYAEIGINSVNYSEKNNSFIVSVGKNEKEEYYPQYHSMTQFNGEWTMQHHLMPDCCYISASTISNNGCLYAICKNGNDNSIEIRKTCDHQLVAKSKKLPYPCTAIEFTKDDRHIVAAIGYYEDDLCLQTPDDIHYYMFNIDGSTEIDISVGESPFNSHKMWTIDSKYIITENLEIINTSDGSIKVLNDKLNHILFPWTFFREWHFWGRFMFGSAISTNDYEHLPNRVKIPCLTVNKSAVFYSTDDDIIEFQPSTNQRIIWGINEKVLCSSETGLYSLNNEDELYYRDYITKSPLLIEKGVQYATVTSDNKMLYVSLKNGVLLIKKNFKLIGIAYIGSSYDMHTTNNGLIGSNREGELFYFDLSIDIK